MPKIVWSQFKVMFKILFFDIRNNICCNIYIGLENIRLRMHFSGLSQKTVSKYQLKIYFIDDFQYDDWEYDDSQSTFFSLWGSHSSGEQRVLIPTGSSFWKERATFKFSIKICNKLFYLLSRCLVFFNPTSLSSSQHQ